VHIDKNISVNVPELAKRLFFICSPSEIQCFAILFPQLLPFEELLHFTLSQVSQLLCSLQDLNIETELEAVNGRRVRAIEVFSHALHFFREHALKVHFKAPVHDCSMMPHGGHIYALDYTLYI